MKMKNIIKIAFLLMMLVIVFGCPKKPVTPPPESYNNNIDVRFAGSWNLYTENLSEDSTYYYPTLVQENYLVASSDSLVINSQLIGGNDNHGVFFADNQIGYKDKDDKDIYCYDYYYNKDLNRIWLRVDTTRVITFNYDPMIDLQDSTLTLNDFMLLYPSSLVLAPNLTSPENNTDVGKLNPELKWDAYSNATSYHVQVTKDSVFTNQTVFVVDDTITHNHLTINQDLDNFTKYYWRVKANNSLWSSIYSFNTFYVVSLDKPDNGSFTSRKPTFSWHHYDDAETYHIQISLSDDFTSDIIIDESISNNEYIPTIILDANKRYYWRVEANNSGGQWSLVRSFITDKQIKLNNPSNGATGVDVSNINFQWDALDNASTYHIQIADSLSEDDEPVNIVVDIDTLTSNSYNSLNELEDNKKYYWRVTSDVAGKWSVVFDFYTNTSVFLREPENNLTQSPTIIEFKWDKLTSQDEQYIIQIADNENFSNAFIDTVETTNDIVKNLQSNTQYYWRVKVDDSEWSDVWTFTTMEVIIDTHATTPADSSTNISQKPAFSWYSVDDANYYWIKIATDPNFESVIFEDLFTAQTFLNHEEEYKLEEELLFNQTYYWKVKSDVSNWSSVMSFSVESGIPASFTVVSTSPFKFDMSWMNTATENVNFVLERWDSETQEWAELPAYHHSTQVTHLYSSVDFDKDPNISYKYRVKAVSEDNQSESEYAYYPENDGSIQPMDFEAVNYLPEMVNVQAGSFDMGSTTGDSDEQPVHHVTLTRDFMMSKYEISISKFVDVINYGLGKGYIKNSSTYLGQFYTENFYNYASNAIPISNLFLGSTPIDFDMDTHKFVYNESDAKIPIYDITYLAAALYCYTLNKIENNDGFYNISSVSATSDPYNGNGYRLPTEAEWEYVAQYNDGRTYPWGNSEPDKEHANYFGSGWGNIPLDIDACPSGANSLGIYNMAGNVWEWCNDNYGAYTSDDVTDPIGPPPDTNNGENLNTHKVIRGGSCELESNYLRNQNRSNCKVGLLTGKVNSKIGFRIVKVQ